MVTALTFIQSRRLILGSHIGYQGFRWVVGEVAAWKTYNLIQFLLVALLNFRKGLSHSVKAFSTRLCKQWRSQETQLKSTEETENSIFWGGQYFSLT